jgi:hypothetical protein
MSVRLLVAFWYNAIRRRSFDGGDASLEFFNKAWKGCEIIGARGGEEGKNVKVLNIG